jgi:hypothetical protein
VGAVDAVAVVVFPFFLFRSSKSHHLINDRKTRLWAIDFGNYNIRRGLITPSLFHSSLI